MKIILKQNVEKIGQVGDVVEVSDGFARNFLIPRGKAISFTASNFKTKFGKNWTGRRCSRSK